MTTTWPNSAPAPWALSVPPVRFCNAAFETFLLVRLCVDSLKSAVAVVVLYHVFQIAYIFAYRAIATKYS